jgi:hypothetical protein
MAKTSFPRWLRETTARLGLPETSAAGMMRRWLWSDGEVGVVIDRPSHTWQVVAFTPARSVTLRSSTEPTDRQIRAVVELAGVGYDAPPDTARPDAPPRSASESWRDPLALPTFVEGGDR